MFPDPRGATRRDIQIKIGGQAGFGIKAAGQTLARCFMRGGLHTFDLTEYPSLIRGGHNVYQVRVSPDPIYSHVTPVDILVALNQETLTLHLGELSDGAAITDGLGEGTGPAHPTRAPAATTDARRKRNRRRSSSRSSRFAGSGSPSLTRAVSTTARRAAGTASVGMVEAVTAPSQRAPAGLEA